LQQAVLQFLFLALMTMIRVATETFTISLWQLFL